MDDKTKALKAAAFHAWVTLGDLLVNTDAVPRAEIETVYAALHEALAAFDEPK